jgi:Glycosyltransferase family 43
MKDLIQVSRRSKRCCWLASIAALAVVHLGLKSTTPAYRLKMFGDADTSVSSFVPPSQKKRWEGLLPPTATARHPTADALDAAPESGLDSIEPFVLGARGVLEHLEYHHPGGGGVGGATAQRDVLRSLGTTEPLVYFVTLTYYRTTQMADMTRLAQTLMHDNRIYWIVVEDRSDCTVRIRALLERTGLPYAHVAVRRDPAQKLFREGNQRNRGLDVVEQVNLPGVVFFGDDDNSYDGA